MHQPRAGSPGDAAHHAAGALDAARLRTRFPPEPNGYLHVGHAKSICLNFGLARDHGGICHLRFDDTNPEKEEQEFVDAIIEAVHWLGFQWDVGGTSHLYYASSYFDFMYRAAEALVTAAEVYYADLKDEAKAVEIAGSRRLMLGLAMSILARSTAAPSASLPSRISRNRCRFSSIERER